MKQELIEANEKIRDEVAAQKKVISTLRDSVNKLLIEQNKPTIDDEFTNLSDLSSLVLDLINEQKATRRELVMQQQALDNHAIVATIDLAGTILAANDKCCQFSGFSHQELIGKTVESFNVRNLSTEQQIDILRELIKGDIWQGELHSVTKSGLPWFFFATAVPFRNYKNRIDRIVVICTDITEQKHLERRLERGRAFYRSITDSIGEGVYAVDASGRAQFLNPKAKELLGWSLEELKTRRFHDTVHYQMGDGTLLPREQCPVNLSISECQTYTSYEDHFTDKKGRLFPISMVAVPLLNKDGIPDGHVGVFSDISEQKEIERKLQRAFEEAENANKAKSTFLATMSHEIRTPLNAIIGLTHLAIEADDVQQKQVYLEKVQKSSTSLLDLINSILDFSKVEANKVDIANEPFFLQKIVDKLAQIFQFKAQQKKLLLLFDLRCNTNIECTGDSEKVYQVLLNLLSNAIKFTSKGQVIFSVAQQDQALTFSVSDTGIGISKENRGKLFKAFEQADASTSRKYGGTGLGLAICDKLVKQMGGELVVTSQLGKGSQFSFSLPLCQPYCHTVKTPYTPPLSQSVTCINTNESVANCTNILEATLSRLGIESTIVGEPNKDTREHSDLTFVVLPLDEVAWTNFAKLARCKEYGNLYAITVVSPLPKEHARKLLGEELYQQINVLELPFTDTDLIYALSPPTTTPQKDNTETLESKKWRRNRLTGKAALVVDDDPISLEVSQHILADVGIHVTTVGSAEQALALCTHTKYDVILLDCHMPGMNGYELVEHLTCLEDWMTPIITLSADETFGGLKQTFDAAMCQHLTKPATANEIIHTIDTHIHSGYKEIQQPQSPNNFIGMLLNFYDKYGTTEVMSQLLDILNGSATNTTLLKDLEEDAQHIGAETLYNTVLNYIGKRTETKINRSDIITQISMQLDATLSLIAHTIERYHIEERGNQNGQALDVNEFLDDLTQVTTALENYDVKALEKIAVFSSKYVDSHYAIQVDQIKQRVNAYDFDSALEQISKLREQISND